MRGKTPVHRSAIVERVKYEMKADKVLKKRIQDLADKITNSQRQT
jgi:hypothetical protein